MSSDGVGEGSGVGGLMMISGDVGDRGGGSGSLSHIRSGITPSKVPAACFKSSAVSMATFSATFVTFVPTGAPTNQTIRDYIQNTMSLYHIS